MIVPDLCRQPRNTTEYAIMRDVGDAKGVQIIDVYLGTSTANLRNCLHAPEIGLTVDVR